MTRQSFDETRDVTAIAMLKPKRVSYRCAADGCPMPGAIFPEGTSNETTAKGVCMWHYGELPDKWPKITERMNDWRPMTDAINGARRCLTDPKTCTNAKAQNLHMQRAAEILRHDLAWYWHPSFKPHEREDYGHWAQRLTRLFTDAISGKLTPSPYVEEIGHER